jgi:hypothetical protein
MGAPPDGWRARQSAHAKEGNEVRRPREATPSVDLGVGSSSIHLRSCKQYTRTIKPLRARMVARDVDDLAKQLTVLLEARELGVIDAEGFAWQAGNLGARLGAMAARGDLRVAS